MCAISPSLASRCPGLTSSRKPWVLMGFPLVFSQGYSHFCLSSPCHLGVSLGLEQESPGTEVGSLHTLSTASDHLASSLSLLAKHMCPVSLVSLVWWLGCFPTTTTTSSTPDLSQVTDSWAVFFLSCFKLIQQFSDVVLEHQWVALGNEACIYLGGPRGSPARKGPSPWHLLLPTKGISCFLFSHVGDCSDPVSHQ